MATHGKMKVVPNNCVTTIKIPRKVESVYGVDYNPVLGLYATFNYDDGVSVWDPVSGKVLAEFEELGENFRDTLFVPGDRLAVSSSEGNHGGSIQIFTLGKDQSDSDEFEIEDLPMTYPGALALSPGRNLLVTDAFNSGEGVHEISMDWHNLKVLKCREFDIGDEDADGGISLLCCSPDFNVTTYVYTPQILSSAKVCFNSEGEVEIQEQVTITYYMLDGEEKQIDEKSITGLVHDGQNLIIAVDDEIVLLESITEGSNGHLIASDIEPSGQIRLNHEGQLMVCDTNCIKLFEYNCNPRPLQDLCRCNVRKTIHTVGYVDKVNSLAIPSMLKNYLLYK